MTSQPAWYTLIVSLIELAAILIVYVHQRVKIKHLDTLLTQQKSVTEEIKSYFSIFKTDDLRAFADLKAETAGYEAQKKYRETEKALREEYEAKIKTERDEKVAALEATQDKAESKMFLKDLYEQVYELKDAVSQVSKLRSPLLIATPEDIDNIRSDIQNSVNSHLFMGMWRKNKETEARREYPISIRGSLITWLAAKKPAQVSYYGYDAFCQAVDAAFNNYYLNDYRNFGSSG